MQQPTEFKRLQHQNKRNSRLVTSPQESIPVKNKPFIRKKRQETEELQRFQDHEHQEQHSEQFENLNRSPHKVEVEKEIEGKETAELQRQREEENVRNERYRKFARSPEEVAIRKKEFLEWFWEQQNKLSYKVTCHKNGGG
jgi:macrodomain Ter protein organizer (MatP/YcbG family)